MIEQAVTFQCDKFQQIGIIHQPNTGSEVGVLIVVGGPQYRVGSHRQFLQLSRYLADNGVPSMRFDYRGMGDSYGEKRLFDEVCEDINAAIDCFFQQCPDIKNVVIWGLCDAASAALIYAYKDVRVKGLILLNPWLKNDRSQAKAMVKFYYLQRLSSIAFWKKLLAGKVNVASSLLEAKGFVADSVQPGVSTNESYQNRMLQGAIEFEGDVCLILSGNDLTAREFIEETKSNKQWRSFLKSKCIVHRMADADHTFSSLEFKNKVAAFTLNFLIKLEQR